MLNTIIQALLGFCVNYLRNEIRDAKAAKADAYRELINAYDKVQIVETDLRAVKSGEMTDEEFDNLWSKSNSGDTTRVLRSIDHDSDPLAGYRD